MILFGLILCVPRLQELFARATGDLGGAGGELLSHLTLGGLTGQFCVGLLLGVVWSPCVGPTLGAATTLASRGQNLAQISLLMMVFGLGAAAPLVILGSVSRSRMLKIRGTLLSAGSYGRRVLGLLILAMGILIVSGADKGVESWVLDHTPDWLTAVTTRF